MRYDGIILANFGGPRTQDEIYEFLKTLLCDQDVIQTGWLEPLHKLLFTYIAKKRTGKVTKDYAKIGGASPIYFDTLKLKEYLTKKLDVPVYDFHRYLPKTHDKFLSDVENHKGQKLLVLPLFPQFSYATTGSIARFFETHLCGRTLEKLEWIASYETHESFIKAYMKNIKNKLLEHHLDESDVCLFYSFHGVPRKFTCFNDPYQKHCQASFEALKKHFPHSDHMMAFQSKFGKGEWLKPYTSDLVEGDLQWLKKKHVLFVPLSFTSDHIETLFEVEYEYKMVLEEKGISAFRVEAIAQDFSWAYDIIDSSLPLVSTSMCVRKEKKACCNQKHNCCLCKKTLKNNTSQINETLNTKN
jgi:protoporphyrin/coproporphyrin ferrochelatase